ncbi:hypothetical protein B0J13DRAFT_561959 [Dactylonectria estremocensis]|uniref:Uncharacterized protein n=1 Tax=Dactylonectria estremocensis TaxID=1079267 RepID=A0A9P9ITX0_9HYPO|nr:hypothetical protein B0J13DRAFT_561959 [Dactylonectria estremocensis]
MGISRASCAEMWGVEENSRGWRIWLLFAVFLGLMVNFIAVLGCLSDATSSIYLYKLEQTELLAAIETVTNRSAATLKNSALPDTWYWGLSGVCDSNHNCKRAFPPTFSLGGIVENSLKAEIGDNKEAYAKAVAPWASVIRSHGIDGSSSTKAKKLHDERNKFVPFAKASAALATLALLTSVTILVVTVATMSSRAVPLWALYLGTFFDGLLLLGATTLAIYALRYGPHSLIQYAGTTMESHVTPEYMGPGMYTLAGGVLVKFLAIAGVFVGFIIFGFISLVAACLAVMCACACLGAAAGDDGSTYRCSNCGCPSVCQDYYRS